MRGRMAIASAEIECELREILLRDKPSQFLAASPKGTVPVVQDGEDVIEESFDVMMWALRRNDPEGWLDMPGFGFDLIAEADGPFKSALDRYKYASRHPDIDIAAELNKAGLFLHKLDRMLEDKPYLFGSTPKLADIAIAPFVRQFAHVDLDWFQSQPWTALTEWLEIFKASERFQRVMKKYPVWTPGQDIVVFPNAPL